MIRRAAIFVYYIRYVIYFYFIKEQITWLQIPLLIQKKHQKRLRQSRRKDPCTSMARKAAVSNLPLPGKYSNKYWRVIGHCILSGPVLRFSALPDSARITHTMELQGNSGNVFPKSVLQL